MKLVQIACLLGLVMVLPACSDNDPNPSADDTNSSDAPSDDGNPVRPKLSNNNYSGIVGYALTFFGNRPLPGSYSPGVAPQDFTQPESTVTDPDTGLETRFFTCSNGGTANNMDNPDPFGLNYFLFDNCQYNGNILNGQLGHYFGKYGSELEMRNFNADIGGGASIHQATGDMKIVTRAPCSHQERVRSVEQYTITQGDELFEIKDWNTSYILEYNAEAAAPFCGASDFVEISGGFTVRSGETDNNWLEVNATETVTGTHDNPTAGVVTITTNDASSIVINFATGDDSTVGVTITNSSGESSFDEPLTTWINSLLLP